MLELRDGTKRRLDIYPRYSYQYYKKFLYQKLLYENGVNVAEPLKFIIFHERKFAIGWKLSNWIEGVRVLKVWDLEETFERIGEQVARINSIKDTTTGGRMALFDFSKLNGIWTYNDEVYIIDLSVKPYKNIKYSVYKILISLRTKSRINSFLKGYSKICPIDSIVRYGETKKWKWDGVELELNEKLKNRKVLLSNILWFFKEIDNASNTD
jgi:hypothetical protein